jgi:hypothetical protein
MYEKGDGTNASRLITGTNNLEFLAIDGCISNCGLVHTVEDKRSTSEKPLRAAPDGTPRFRPDLVRLVACIGLTTACVFTPPLPF